MTDEEREKFARELGEAATGISHLARRVAEGVARRSYPLNDMFSLQDKAAKLTKLADAAVAEFDRERATARKR